MNLSTDIALMSHLIRCARSEWASASSKMFIWLKYSGLYYSLIFGCKSYALLYNMIIWPIPAWFYLICRPRLRITSYICYNRVTDLIELAPFHSKKDKRSLPGPTKDFQWSWVTNKWWRRVWDYKLTRFSGYSFSFLSIKTSKNNDQRRRIAWSKSEAQKISISPRRRWSRDI